jgi:RES domain-containing protein
MSPTRRAAVRHASTGAPVTAAVRWKACFRVTSWQARPEAVFEAVTDPADLEDVLAVLAAGAPARVDPAKAATGPGAGWVMLPFLRFGPTRFSDGNRYGVFYAGRVQATAIAETTYHYARFLAASHEPPTFLGVQMLRCSVKGTMVDIRGAQVARPDLYDPDPANYGPAQHWADGLHRAGQDGIVYDSVRHRGGSCVAVFDPRCVTGCRRVGSLVYEWDGTAIVRAHRLREVWRP